MKTLIFTILLSAIIISLPQCDKNNNSYEQPGTTGKQHFTIVTDGINREYYVHVPARYDAKNPTPAVFMLHGSGGNGEKFYNISGWKEERKAGTDYGNLKLLLFSSGLAFPMRSMEL